MKAYELLDSPEKWTKGSLARDVNNIVAHELGSEAVCWCTAGAIYRCYPDIEKRRQAFNRLETYLELTQSYAKSTVPSWNDALDTPYEEVVSTLKKLNI